MSKQTRAKFKSIFGRKSSSTDSCSAEDKFGSGLVFSKEVLVEISESNSVINRARALKEFSDVVLAKKLEEHAIDKLLVTIDDLLDASVSIEGRQAALHFLVSLTTGQYQYLGILRTQIFRIILNHNVEEDLDIRITLLKVLTDQGKDISYCEQIGAFLVDFMSKALYSSNAHEFLKLLVNILHYNSSFLDKGIISTLVYNTCKFCDQIDGDRDIENCLLLLDASVRYGGLTSNGISPLIRTLCWTVNIEKFCQPSWNLMRNLTGTNLGHTAIYFMCQLLEDSKNFSNTTLLRGAIFFTGMCIWGSKRVTSLYYDAVHVLPSFKSCLFSADPLVAKEISLSLQRLVKKFGSDQEIVTWDIILDITEMLLKLAEGSGSNEINTLYINVHSIISTIEQLYVENKFNGCSNKLFQILASCAKDRPIHSVLLLLGYYQELVNPSNVDWLEVLKTVFEDFFCKEIKTMIRIEVIKIINTVFRAYHHKHEDDIISVFINDYFLNISNEHDSRVRLEVSKLLSTMLMQCSSTNYPVILNIIESLILGIGSYEPDMKENIKDIEVSVHGLIEAFKEKLFIKSSHNIVNILIILFNHINHHYIHYIKGSSAGLIRKCIFALLLSIRVNDKHCIGLVGSSVNKFSSHVIFKTIQNEEVLLGSYNKMSLDIHDFQNAFDVLLKCLKNELDWLVLECVLENLESQLQNKNLFVYCECNMNKLCSALCNLVNDKMYLNNVRNCPPNMGISELRNLIFPILSVIATYKFLSRDRQFELVSCIEFGLNTHCAQTCVSCLSICILEMEQVMIRLLPSILVKLSQISATAQLAIPVLEFLSTLKEIPSLYTNFVEEQYMSIFAMALSYTDSYRYSPYIVTLAHQIIADWFTRCRLTYRKGFVMLIKKALRSSTLINEKNEKDGDHEKNNEIKLFHEEMTLICLDMMARYSYSNNIRTPRRSNVMELLLSTGISKTWVAENMLITITTCSNIPGHCSSCAVKCDTLDQIVIPSSNLNKRLDGINSSLKSSEMPNLNYLRDENKRELANHDLSINFDEKHDSAYLQNRYDSSILLGKLTEILANPNTDMKMFSPSESLLFSRQGSKSLNTCNSTVDEDEINDSICDNIAIGNLLDDDKSSTAQSTHSLGEAEYLKNDLSNNFFHGGEKSVYNDFKHNLGSEVLNNEGRQLYDSSLLTDNKQQHFTVASSEMQQKCSRNTVSYEYCECSCIGWAEVYIRRPTGNISWIMEIDNSRVDCSLFPDLTMSASSRDYLDLYKKLSCSFQKQETAVLPSEERSTLKGLFRSHSTGSIVNAANLPMKTSHIKLADPSFDNSFNLFPSHNLISPHSNLMKINNDVRSDSCKGDTLSSSHKLFPGYASDSLPETQNRNSINPSFIFLQLFYSTLDISENYPFALQQTEVVDRAMKILDRIPSANTHKFGVLYVSKGQFDSEMAILSNQYGSARYADFISGLGNIINLNASHPIHVFTGGLDSRGKDGNFAYHWKDETTQVIFHIATLMPNKENDVRCVSKKMHIGNNFVTVIYDDTKHGYKFGTIKGQFNYAEIVVRPLEYESNMVFVRFKETIDGLNQAPKIVSDVNLSVLVRQLAIHTNMAVVTELTEKKLTNAFTSNWLERLRQIKRIKTKGLAEVKQNDASQKNDFT